MEALIFIPLLAGWQSSTLASKEIDTHWFYAIYLTQNRVTNILKKKHFLYHFTNKNISKKREFENYIKTIYSTRNIKTAENN